jgi:hypothetical protein
MPTIGSSADLRNKYNDISYEMLRGKAEIYRLLDEGLEAERVGDLHPLTESFAEIRRELANLKTPPPQIV